MPTALFVPLSRGWYLVWSLPPCERDVTCNRYISRYKVYQTENLVSKT